MSDAESASRNQRQADSHPLMLEIHDFEALHALAGFNGAYLHPGRSQPQRGRRLAPS